MYQTQLNIIEKCEFICYCVMTLFFFSLPWKKYGEHHSNVIIFQAF